MRLILRLPPILLIAALAACSSTEQITPVEPTTAPTVTATAATTAPPIMPVYEATTEPAEPTAEATEATTGATEPAEPTTTAYTNPPPLTGDLKQDTVAFQIVDAAGKPLAGVSGGLELTTPTEVSYNILTGLGAENTTDETGVLYMNAVKPANIGKQYKLILTARYDPDMKHEQVIALPQPPTVVAILWGDESPPSALPPQDDGIRIFIVDPAGNPVEGVTIAGSPYPIETEGPVPDIAMQTLPSDADGYIRWEKVEPGTYELFGHKGDETQEVTLVMPGDQAMTDVTIVWNP